MSGPHCFENPPNMSAGAGNGKVEVLAVFKTYITGSSDSGLAIIFLSDAFGFEAPNLRKLADKVAAAGYLVVVPDFLYGTPADVNDPNFSAETWINQHPPEKGNEDAKLVIETLKARGATSIGAAGFCWGGMVLAKLASSNDIRAGVILHPGKITEDEIIAVKIPIAILGAEKDHIFPAEELEKLGKISSAKPEIDSYVKIFPGVKHGWSVRYNVEDESALRSAEQAHQDMLDWLRKHVN